MKQTITSFSVCFEELQSFRALHEETKMQAHQILTATRLKHQVLLQVILARAELAKKKGENNRRH